MKYKSIKHPCADCNDSLVTLEAMDSLTDEEIEDALEGRNIELTRKRMIDADMDTSEYEKEFLGNREPADEADEAEKRDDDIAYVPADELVHGHVVCDKCGSDQTYNSDGRNTTGD